MKKYRGADGVIWVFLGTAICIGSVHLGLGSFGAPGAGFLPFLSGALMAVFGFVHLFCSAFSPAEGGEERADGGTAAPAGWKRLVNPLLVVLVLLAYILLLDQLGFLLTTFACLLALFKLSEPRKWLKPLTFSAGTALLSYLLFSVWLQCQLPKGLVTFW